MFIIIAQYSIVRFRVVRGLFNIGGRLIHPKSFLCCPPSTQRNAATAYRDCKRPPTQPRLLAVSQPHSPIAAHGIILTLFTFLPCFFFFGYPHR
jgi:hypothetical protein